jgi:predicted acetyltransferase
MTSSPSLPPRPTSTPADPEPPHLTVRRADDADRPLLERLWLLFRHDQSAHTRTLPRADGTYRSERLEAALSDPDWAAYLAHLGDAPVGLALVRNLGGEPYVLNSFFVVAAARRAGVGTAFAERVLADHPGDWEVAFQEANRPAVGFWRRVARAHDAGWREERRAVPGSPDSAPDSWVSFGVPGR